MAVDAMIELQDDTKRGGVVLQPSFDCSDERAEFVAGHRRVLDVARSIEFLTHQIDTRKCDSGFVRGFLVSCSRCRFT